MWEEIIKTVSVYFSAMLKFILGPIGGKAAGLNIITTSIVTAAAMMTVVTLLTYFGEFIRAKIIDRFFKSRNKSAKPSRKWIAFIRQYGLAGIAFFTPLLLTPIGGTLLAVGFTKSREKILLYMFISACCWSVILTAAVYFGYDAIVNLVRSFSDY